MKQSLLLLLFATQWLSAQTYELKKDFSATEVRKFVTNDLMIINPKFSYKLSGSDAAISLDEIDENTMNSVTVAKYMALLKKDSLNPLVLSQIATCYNFGDNVNPALARKYFQKAMANMSMRYFLKDSASFYSRRALIKANLGLDDIVPDFEKALRINPADSVATVFYQRVYWPMATM